MTRLMPLVFGVLTCALFVVPVAADDPPKKFTPQERKELEAKWDKLTDEALAAYGAGKLPKARNPFEEALKLARQLYPKTEFPDGHDRLATSLNNLGLLYEDLEQYADAERLLKEALEIRKQLSKGDHADLATALGNLGGLYNAQGKYTAAEPLYKDALDMFKRLYKGDHPDKAESLNNLAALYHAQGKYADAEPLLRDALEMFKRLHKGDHSDVAASMNNLASVLQAQGKCADAEPLFKDALNMNKRLYKGDHPFVANSLNSLAGLFQTELKYADAEPLFKDALSMNKRLYKGNHPDVALSLNNLGSVYSHQGKYAEAETLYKDALEMRKRLYKGDHPDRAESLNNLGFLYVSQGKYEAAEPFLKDALDMFKRLHKRDHPNLVSSLNNLAALFRSQGKYADATPLYRDSLGISRRLTARYAKEKPEGETLTLFATQPLTRDEFLSNELARTADPATVYPEVWFDKGAIARVYERRQQQARAATDPRATKMLAELTDARLRRAELLLASSTTDPVTRKQREVALQEQETRIEKLIRELKPLLPVITRADKLAEALPAELQKVLPADAAVVDFIRFIHFGQDKDIPGQKGKRWTPRYLAFVVTRDKVAWVDLGTDADMKRAVEAWRNAITSGKDIPAAVPAKVRELAWEKVRKELPATIKTVYICPDADLCKVPFAALPGDKAGTILLEDFALATIPHAPFLLDKLWPQDPVKNPTEALVVGAVNYNADVTATTPNARGTSAPLLRPGQKLGWDFLANTGGEVNGVAAGAVGRKLPVTRLDGDKATTAAVLAALPKAKVAHVATHGFFADSSFRSVFQLDEDDYKRSRFGERIGKAANSPLVMTGLVFAGANNPKTPGRGILTGESLIDLDLSGLELAVLSACETGLGDQGDVVGGEGVFGLQRAFHYAGTRNVVVSLWKVPDASTAALMNLFYRNLWTQELSPLEALRQAQLEIYKNPGKIPELAKGFRGKFEEVPGMGAVVEIKPVAGGKAHPLLWAAFTLSGLGR